MDQQNGVKVANEKNNNNTNDKVSFETITKVCTLVSQYSNLRLIIPPITII